jgi:hypothetical protein
MKKNTWTKPSKGWIGGDKKKRPRDIPYGVSYVPAQCPNPKCHSLDVDKYSSVKTTKYCKCRVCGINFKAVPEYQFEVRV